MTNAELCLKFLNERGVGEAHNRHLKFEHGVLSDEMELARFIGPHLCIFNDAPKTIAGKLHIRNLKEAREARAADALTMLPVGAGYEGTFERAEDVLRSVTRGMLSSVFEAACHPSTVRTRLALAMTRQNINTLVSLAPRLYQVFPLLPYIGDILWCARAATEETDASKTARRKDISFATGRTIVLMDSLKADNSVYYTTWHGLVPDELVERTDEKLRGESPAEWSAHWRKFMEESTHLEGKSALQVGEVAARGELLRRAFAERGLSPVIIESPRQVAFYLEGRQKRVYPAALIRAAARLTRDFSRPKTEVTEVRVQTPKGNYTLRVNARPGVCTFTPTEEVSTDSVSLAADLLHRGSWHHV